MSKAPHIGGFEELQKKLNTLRDPKIIGNELRKTTRAAMVETKKVAATKIPVGTVGHITYRGRLVTPGFSKRSLRVISGINKRQGSAWALLGVRAEAFYAIQFVELGTVKMAAQPWLRPTFEASKDVNVKLLGEALRKWILGIAAKKGVGSERYNQLMSSLEDG